MLGAIIGDVAGSALEVLEVQAIKDGHRSYEERIRILDATTDLFLGDVSCTDDSILTCAICDAIMNGNCNYEMYLRKYGLSEVNNGIDKYGRSRFGNGFVSWLEGNYQGESFGNGAAMRIGPVGYLFDTLDDVKKNVYLATIPSHNHPDAIKGAEAVAVTIFLLRTGHSKEDVYKYVTENYYELDFDLEDLQRNNCFSSKSSVTVPQALFVFFQSNSFEDSIRKAISIGGDTDTIACIVGSISEAYYGVPEEIKMRIIEYLPEYMQLVVNQFYGTMEFRSFMKEENMHDEDFWDFMKTRTVVVPGEEGNVWNGCFPKVSDGGTLVDIRLLVPRIDSFDNLLINIHEYTHAYELYNELGKMFNMDRDNREARAIAKEKEYVKRRGEKLW